MPDKDAPGVHVVAAQQPKDLNLAILALEEDAKFVGTILAAGLTVDARHYYERRLKSDRDAIDVLKRHNLPNSPQA